VQPFPCDVNRNSTGKQLYKYNKVDQIAIIVAGGSGKRMNTRIPKQFLLLDGDPVLMRSVRAFHQYNPEMQLIIVLPPDQISYWKTLCDNHAFNIPHRIVEGGKTRHHSVKNALEKVRPGCLVAVHDGVRPLISKVLIKTCFDTAGIFGNAVPAVELSESIRRVKGRKNISTDRSEFRLVQTPQVFKSEILIEAFRQPYNDDFTDEATLVESAGHLIHLVKGESENIKITTTTDMWFATAILESKEL
jgi:2-C-methyl-D-erythritol 4-phosphate cytidylyltransferase